MNNNRYCVIMAGGIGSRFWPLSKEEKPKQFIDILGVGKSFIRQTYERFCDIVPKENFVILTNFAYMELVKEELPELDYSQILCEPARRNTAPCIAYAAYHIHAKNPNAVMIVSPADHLILDSVTFTNVMRKASDFVENQDVLMTIGIKPNRPETGYGYIKTDEPLKENDIVKVDKFVEKPDRDLAKLFVQSGKYLWNSGIFIWSSSAIRKAISQHLPDIDAIFSDGEHFFGTPDEISFIKKAFPMCQSISVDYGIMEKANNVYVGCADFGWSDIGTWGSLWENAKKDKLGNSIKGNKVVCHEVSNSIVRIEGERVAVIDGLDNHIVVCDDNVLLICSMDREQEIKNYINELLLSN